jgi:hypothetical protein
MWQPAPTAPYDRDLKLAVIDATGAHALVFPCRRILSGWMKAGTKQRIEIDPTHWRDGLLERLPSYFFSGDLAAAFQILTVPARPRLESTRRTAIV